MIILTYAELADKLEQREQLISDCADGADKRLSGIFHRRGGKQVFISSALSQSFIENVDLDLAHTDDNQHFSYGFKVDHQNGTLELVSIRYFANVGSPNYVYREVDFMAERVLTEVDLGHPQAIAKDILADQIANLLGKESAIRHLLNNACRQILISSKIESVDTAAKLIAS